MTVKNAARLKTNRTRDVVTSSTCRRPQSYQFRFPAAVASFALKRRTRLQQHRANYYSADVDLVLECIDHF